MNIGDLLGGGSSSDGSSGGGLGGILSMLGGSGMLGLLPSLLLHATQHQQATPAAATTPAAPGAAPLAPQVPTQGPPQMGGVPGMSIGQFLQHMQGGMPQGGMMPNVPVVQPFGQGYR